MNLLLLLAATLTFQNTAPDAAWFSIIQIQATKPIVYVRDNPNPGTVGQVTIELTGGAPGDCYTVTAVNKAGPSGWSNIACLPLTPASAPTGTVVK